MSAQALIDAKAYPPTHDYRVDGLIPRGPLAERVDALESVAPHFFAGRSFLDVGCSKGYFALRAATSSDHVTGIDPDAGAVDAARASADLVGASNVLFECATFGTFGDTMRRSRVFIGNAHHYLYRAARGWEWVAKIARLMEPEGLVLIEGPDDDCPDLGCLSDHLRPGFTRNAYVLAMSAAFTLIGEGETTAYTPGRRIRLWQRNGTNEHRAYLRRAVGMITPAERILEVCCRDDRVVITREGLPGCEVVGVDRNARRVAMAGGPGIVADVLADELPARDVTFSSGIAHHVEDHAALMAALCRGTRSRVVLAGPRAGLVPLPYGDHVGHLDPTELALHARRHGFALVSDRIVGGGGPGDTSCLLVFERRAA